MIFVGAKSSPNALSQYSLSRRRISPCWTLLLSSLAALRVKVRPRISSGLAKPLATRYITLTIISSVLPEPAPATTSDGELSDADSII